MWSPDRYVLLLDNSFDAPLSRLTAALSGLSIVTAPWQRCQASGSGVSIQGAVSYKGGSKLEHSGTITFAPAAIAVIDATPVSLKHGERLAYVTNALWGHCKAALPRWPSWTTRAQQAVEGIWIQHDPRSPTGLTASAAWAQRLVTQRSTFPTQTIDPLCSRTLAPCGVLLTGDSFTLIDGFATNHPDREGQEQLLTHWLNMIGTRAFGAASPIALTSSPFPELFETSRYIDTEYEPLAQPLYIDPSLEVVAAVDDREALHRLVARRRTNRLCANAEDLREVETGVGRACLVQGLRCHCEDLVDFTVLGIGVTPYSEGGFVEVGRKIDGKATVRRGWHRKNCAERLENAGCRAGRVVAMYEVPGDGVQMLDGTVSPEALIVRGFRSTYRVKNLDPLICSLHSTQHTPLVHAYVAQRAIELHRQRGGQRLSELELAHALSQHDASQESLRLLVQGAAPSPHDTSAAAVVRQVRLDVIASQAPRLMATIFQRLADDLHIASQDVDPEVYLRWFARSCGEQLARWHQLRFLYDYHHPGVSRWSPGHIYTLGENNVSLLAEFVDLDTGTFVDDPDEELISILQLPPEDLPVLREGFDFFHQREITATRTVIETLTALLQHSYGALDVNPLAQFDEAYDDGRSRIAATTAAA